MASQFPPPHYPITGVCIVADAQKCPPQYILLLKSHDKKDDCDMGTDSLLRRNQRYLCFTRNIVAAARQHVLLDLQVINEKDQPAPGFTLLDKTCDSTERALKKKHISIKMVPREGATTAICDLLFMSKAKRAPEGYTLAGDINGLALCFKLGNVPLETQAFSHASPSASTIQQPYRPAPLPPIGGQASIKQGGPPVAIKAPVPAPRVALTRSDSVNNNPLADVPFQVSMKHQDIKTLINMNLILQREFRSAIDIKNEYDYEFTVERSAVQQLPVTPC